MKTKSSITTIVCNALLIAVSGCMSIKDTSGIRKYFQHQGKAEILAIEIKAKNPDKDSSAYKTAERLFNKAAGAGNGWASGIVFDARVKREVNVSVEDYINSEAGKAIRDFLALDPGFRPLSFDPVTAAAIATFVVTVIDKIEEQNDKRVERAIKAIEQEFSRSRWTTFENTTLQWIDQKYKFAGREN